MLYHIVYNTYQLLITKRLELSVSFLKTFNYRFQERETNNLGRRIFNTNENITITAIVSFHVLRFYNFAQ